ncbi:MAG: tetratricopeptide repeat protein [Nitrospinales bacterium]
MNNLFRSKISIILSNLALISICIFLIGCSSEEVTLPVSNDPASLVQNAIKEQEIGGYEQAIEILNTALTVDPKFVPAHYRMGLVFEEWDKYKEAAASYTKGLESEPSNVDVRLGLASAYAKLKKNELAIEEYKKAAELKPNDTEIYFKIALEYWYLQDLQNTAKNYEKIIAVNPDHLQAHLNLISVYEAQKKWEKAIEEIEISKRLGKESGNEHAINIAEGKLPFITGRMNMTKADMKKNLNPPFN